MVSRRQVVVARVYEKARRKLREHHKQIDAKFELFCKDPLHNSLDFHELDRLPHKGWWSYKVNDEIRTIVADQQDCWVVCYVDHHDDAYKWAERRRFTVNLQDGNYAIAPPISEVVEQVETVPETTQVFRVPLSGYTPEQIMRLGVPEDWAKHLVQATEEQLGSLLNQALGEGWMPEDVIERLDDLVNGRRPYRELLPPQISVLLPSELFRRRPRDFWSPESEEEIRKAIRGDWQQWIIFLHTSQKEAVERDLQGPIRISGGAGTGKTVVAAHRTAWLAHKYPEARILLTTFTELLANNLRQRVEQIIGPLEGTNIEVENLHSVANRLFRYEMNRTERLIGNGTPEMDALLEEAIQRSGRSESLQFVRAEWEAIIDAWNVRTLDAYLKMERIGRKVPLPPNRREELWSVFEQVWQLLEERSLMTYDAMCHAVAEYVNQHPELRYDCVVVDEAQDFGPAELTLIRALAPADKPNSLFLCADSRQRIYRPAVPWSRFGIDTRGRSYILRVNYRTTQQIQEFSESILPLSIEGFQEDEAQLLAQRPIALMKGVAPEARSYENLEAEMRGLKEWIYRCLNENIQPGEIAIFARSNRVLEEVEHMLEEIYRERGIPGRKLGRETQPVPYEINYGTAHSAKGLEFRAVAVVGVNQSNFPSYAVVKDITDLAERQAKEAQERQLLYTACTRARERLYVSWSPTIGRSKFLEKALETLSRPLQQAHSSNSPRRGATGSISEGSS
ncbi:MAG: DEAD/DEAH box helicase [Armatimonadetes bacterium]|nr:DEAD/DEAH box helicase [Armatimonadota bacterium]